MVSRHAPDEKLNAQFAPKVTILHEHGSLQVPLEDYEKEMDRLLSEGVQVYSASYPGTRPIRKKRRSGKADTEFPAPNSQRG